MGVVVQFNYAAWVARYPEMTAVSATAAAAYFTEATLTHANDGSGPINSAEQQLLLLNMLTAHIAWMNSPRNTAGLPDSAGTVQPSGIVGRITSASEGSVSVQTDNQYPPGTAQWFQQTVYGSAYWAATARFRTMFYIPQRDFRRW